MMTKTKHKFEKSRPCAAYDEEGVCIGVGDSINDLARQLKVSASTIAKCLKHGSKRYAYILDDDEIGDC